MEVLSKIDRNVERLNQFFQQKQSSLLQKYVLEVKALNEQKHQLVVECEKKTQMLSYCHYYIQVLTEQIKKLDLQRQLLLQDWERVMAVNKQKVTALETALQQERIASMGTRANQD
jgi:hypothetical protein